jgi:hypothetical protein
MRFSDFYKTINEGFSHETEHGIIAIWGTKPYNIDVQNALLHNVSFNFKDDEGKNREGGHINIKSHKNSSPLTYQQEKTGQIRETVMSIVFPKGSKNAALKSIKSALKPFNLNAEYLPVWRDPQTRK